ncbi:MAG: flagellin FliC [Myxococcales bacterium]|nr:flagellin FliC [Myxococcales bacterium]
MPFTVNTNMAASNALNKLGQTTHKLGGAFERISSGLRINKASDDAAGLGMAENLDAEARGLRQAMRNANDGVSVIEVAEGAHGEVSNLVKRMRELAVQSSSETLADTERTYIQSEFTELSAEVERIAQVTEFNGQKIADGGAASGLTQLNVQVGVNDSANDRIAIKITDLRATALGVDTGSIDLSTAAGAQTALTSLDTALDTLNTSRSDLGSVQSRLESAMRNLGTYTEHVEGAQSRIRDADFAYETAQMSKFQIMQQAGVAVLGQANQLNQGALRLLG